MGDKELSDAAKAVDRLDALVPRAASAGVTEGAVGDIGDVPRLAMDDDFDTPAALAFVFELVRQANTALDAGDTADVAAPARDRARAVPVRSVSSSTTAADEHRATTPRSTRWSSRARRSARRDATSPRPTASATSCKARGVTLEDGAGGTTWHR